MSYLGTFQIDDYVGIPAATHRFSSGAAYAPTALTYSIYEEATAVGIDEDVDMVVASPFDSVTGCYWVRRQLTTAAGFEAGKNYLVVVKATVDAIAAIQMHTFQVEAAVTLDASGYVKVSGTKNTLDVQYEALKKLIMLLARKDAAAAADLVAELAELNADLGSGAGAYASTTDSLEALQATVAAIVAVGTGTGTYTDTVTDGANPLDGVRVTLYSDAGMTSAKYQAFTDASGVFTMYPDPGTYYRKLELSGFSFVQGVAVVVA